MTLPKKITGFTGDLQEFTYDTYGRVITDRVTVDGLAHTTSMTYDQYSRVTNTTYPSGFALNTAYDANGYVNTLKNGSNTVTLYTNTGMNTAGQYTAYTLGNGKSSTITYDNLKRPSRYYTAGKQDLNLVWNTATGNLTSRQDVIKGKTEQFTYDNLNRLLTSTVTGLSAITMTYGTNGNINSKTDAGSYTYSLPKPNAVSQVTNPSGNIPSITQNITYTPYFQPATIAEGTNNLTYTYGHDQQRIKGVLTQNGVATTTRYYFAGYEKDITSGSTKHLHYINAGQGLIAIVVRENDADTYYYTYTDHLGSILMVTNSSGTNVAEQNFDAWGRKRNTTTWTYSGVQTVPSWLYRGFTGHEHLTQFGLVNMNGRLYDPVMGRMLSVDNHVQMPDYTQNYNRYSYALNNPLRFTDPDGELFWMIPIVASAVFGTVNLTVQALNGEINSFGDGLRAFGGGALAGFTLGTGVALGLGVPVLSTAIKTIGCIYAGTATLSTVNSVQYGIKTGDWSGLKNTAKIFFGNFYLDSNRSLLGQAFQGISRFSWEILQSTVGHAYSQHRNALGTVDYVGYFGGAVFSISTNQKSSDGVSIGNHINLNIRNDIQGSFQERVLSDPLFMHEYGHTFDSKLFGLSYLFAIGIPSLLSADKSSSIPGELYGVSTHDFKSYEMRANRHASKYFGKHFGINWTSTPYRSGTYESYFPTKKR